MHPADLLGAVQRAAVERAGLEPQHVDQIVAGCVSQVGEQAFNVARTAWLAAGLPLEVAATTVDSQCGSSQQASTLAAGLIGSGLEDVVLSCGVESMSRIPLGANFSDKALGRPMPDSYFPRYAFKSQFQGAELIAKEYGIAREDTDRFGLRSQQLAKRAWDEGRFEREVVPIDAPVRGEDGKPTGETPPRLARRGAARELAREARDAQGRCSRAACTRRARPRRSPTARRRCCSRRRRP